MSFYLSNTNQLRPGPIRNAGSGSVCERVCIETTKVFDACISQIRETSLSLTATNYSPSDPTTPLTYISAECVNTGITVSNVVIDRLVDRPNFATVSCDVTLPVVITYRDANGVIGTADSSFTLTRSAVLFVPQPAMTPVNITALASCISTRGSYEGDNLFVVDMCINIVIKVTAVVDLLIPSYGYCCIPACQEITTAVCPGLDATSIFPTALN